MEFGLNFDGICTEFACALNSIGIEFDRKSKFQWNLDGFQCIPNGIWTVFQCNFNACWMDFQLILNGLWMDVRLIVNGCPMDFGSISNSFSLDIQLVLE